MLGTIALELFDVVRAASRRTTRMRAARDRVRALAARCRAAGRAAHEAAPLQNTVLAFRVGRGVRFRFGFRLRLRLRLGLGLWPCRMTALGVREFCPVPARSVAIGRRAAHRLRVVAARLETLGRLRLRFRLSSNRTRRSVLRAITRKLFDISRATSRRPPRMRAAHEGVRALPA